MRREETILRRQKLLDRLPVTGEILRGSLLERTIRNHASGCAKCASGEGHPLSVLTVTYPGGRTRQFSLRRERVREVRRWLRNYRDLKEAIEAICELNHERNGQKWRTGCEGRISVVKRRHGLNRCQYKGENGMKCWVGLGAISHNLINIGRAIAKQTAQTAR
jgi:hypothetical protein